jgi:hypothetical protein
MCEKLLDEAPSPLSSPIQGELITAEEASQGKSWVTSSLQFVKNVISRRVVWVPILTICVLLLAWSFVLKPLLAHTPIDGEWKGKGEGDVTDISFIVKNGVVKDVTVILGPKQGVMLSGINLGNECKVKSGEFSLDNNETQISGVFDSKTQASGKLYIEQTSWEERRVGMGVVTIPTSITRTWEGKWTAQLEPQNK